MKTTKTMIKLEDVIIPKSFTETCPREEKLDKVRTHIKKYKTIDRPIVLDGKILTDSYTRYLVAKEFGFKEVPYITVQEHMENLKNKPFSMPCVAGKFLNCDKEFVWKNPKNIPLEIGDRVMVKSNSKDGVIRNKYMFVTKTFISYNPDAVNHQPVVKKLVSLDWGK